MFFGNVLIFTTLSWEGIFLVEFDENIDSLDHFCGSVDPQISPRRSSSTAGREGRARLKRAFSPKGGSGRANKSLYGLEVQSQEDTNVRT